MEVETAARRCRCFRRRVAGATAEEAAAKAEEAAKMAEEHTMGWQRA